MALPLALQAEAQAAAAAAEARGLAEGQAGLMVAEPLALPVSAVDLVALTWHQAQAVKAWSSYFGRRATK